MGIDTLIFSEVTGPVDFAMANQIYGSTTYDGHPIIALVEHPEILPTPLSDMPWGEDGYARLSTGARYYSKDYARGPWPSIRFDLLFMEKHIGPTYYGSDTCWHVERITPELIADLDEFYLKYGELPYRNEEAYRAIIKAGEK